MISQFASNASNGGIDFIIFTVLFLVSIYATHKKKTFLKFYQALKSTINLFVILVVIYSLVFGQLCPFSWGTCVLGQQLFPSVLLVHVRFERKANINRTLFFVLLKRFMVRQTVSTLTLSLCFVAIDIPAALTVVFVGVVVVVVVVFVDYVAAAVAVF